MNENPCSNQEIHVLFEHGSKLENTENVPCIICMTLCTERIVDQTDHFADVFVRVNVAYGYDVMTFESTQPTAFCLEKSSVRKWTIKCLAAFSVRIELE